MKLFLIDGHALVFKMYYAFMGRPMVNSKGIDTSILFGFTKYLLELLDRERPEAVAVGFDPPGGTFRNQMYPEYKANRAETPQLVIDALEPLTNIVKAMNIPVLMISGFEADDVLGSVAKQFSSELWDVYMVTPDKDYGQLISDHVYQIRPGKSGSDAEILGVEQVCAKWNISAPSQVIDVLTLCGDSADNIPGVAGVGPVGAAKLLNKYGTLKEIYNHIDELTPKQRESFRQAEGHIWLSHDLVTIKTDIEIPCTIDQMKTDIGYSAELERLFDEYEFPSLKRLVRKISGKDAPDMSEAGLFASAVEPQPALKALAQVPLESFAPAASVSILLEGSELYIAHRDQWTHAPVESFARLLADENISKIGSGVKSILKAFADRGVVLRGRLYDLEIMHYLLNPERNHSLEALAEQYLGISLEGEDQVEQASLFDVEEAESQSRDYGRELGAVLDIYEKLNAEMGSVPVLAKLYADIEEPLISVLARMEQVGVKVDINSLAEFADDLRSRISEKEAFVREITGEPSLNLSSPKQLGVLIYEKLKLDPRAKKSRTGSWPTDEQTLSELSDKSPIIDAILDYRGLKKLLSTYIEPFGSYISPRDGRVHTSFNQALTSTGRLSSSNPNLQNIPIRTEEGRKIRKAFVAQDADAVMMSADYSQIELRLMAHLCGDEHLISAFRSGQDVHSATAAKIFNIPLEEVNADHRRVAKTANFGIMYGISAFGLSQRLHCSRTEAKKIIDDYFESFPSIRRFIDETLQFAKANGYVQTIFGRRRYIADINSRNANLRAFAERNAVNAPIQGSAADIIKLAMIAVDRTLREKGLRARMVLQIHDELLLEVPQQEIDVVRNILVQEMENVLQLSVPLTVECSYGKTWLDAH